MISSQFSPLASKSTPYYGRHTASARVGHRNLARAVATVVLLVIDGAKLAGGYAVQRAVRTDDITAVAIGPDGGREAVGSVAYLEGDALRQGGDGEEVEIVDWEGVGVGCGGVVAVGHIEDIARHVLLDHEPGAAAEAQALALADGVEPQAAVRTDAAPCGQFDDVAGLLAEITAQVVVVVYLAQEADALRVLALGIDEVLLLGQTAHFVLHHVAYGEDGLAQLPVVDLCQEVGLVLDGVGTGDEPLAPLGVHLSLCIVAGGDEVVGVAALFMEGAELDKAVAHDVRVWRIAGPHLFHGVARHLVPVFAVAIDHLQPAAVTPRHDGGHLDVLLGGAVPLFFLLGSYLDIEAVRRKAHPGQLAHDDGAINTAREKDGNTLVFEFVVGKHGDRG